MKMLANGVAVCILDKLFNPQRNDIVINKKGLVVGQVQSGKTANYTGLICKAADAGFNLIIILAGIHNNLRSQTQNRIDEGFLGFDTQNTRAYDMNRTIRIGVGLIPGFDKAIANSYTTSTEHGDFTSRAANTAGFNFNNPQPIILVIKKNASVLKRLFSWLQTQSSHGAITNKALLLVDDEADNASINTSRDGDDPTAINKNICRIIKLFNRSAYVGYTVRSSSWEMTSGAKCFCSARYFLYRVQNCHSERRSALNSFSQGIRASRPSRIW